MKITNLEQTAKIIKHLSKKGVVAANVVKVEGKAVQFSPDGIVTVEVQVDSNKNRIKVGDKVSVAVENGEITLVERAAKEKTLVDKAKDVVTKVASTVVKEPATRSCSHIDAKTQR